MTAVFKILKNRLDVRLKNEVFNSEPYLFGVRNGVIDLRTGNFQPHNFETHVTGRANVSFNPDAKAPRWRRFISEVVPEHEDYIQTMMGYSITGLTDLQKLWILTGNGSNGKSTFLETLMGIVGRDYAQKAAHNALLQNTASATASPELVRMRGKRLILLSETAQNASLNENNVKQLTGGDTITARGLFADFIEFYVIGKFILATNHLPKIAGTDEAIWRRLEVIRFDGKFNYKSDPNLKQDLQNEREGILNWLIEGAVAFYKNGCTLDSTKEMIQWKSEYRNGEDLLKPFLEEFLEEVEGASVAHSEIYQSYSDWASSNGIDCDSSISFGKKMGRRGYKSRKVGKFHTLKYMNIKLKGSGAELKQLSIDASNGVTTT